MCKRKKGKPLSEEFDFRLTEERKRVKEGNKDRKQERKRSRGKEQQGRKGRKRVRLIRDTNR